MSQYVVYEHGLNVNLRTTTKLNFFEEIKNQIEQKNNKEIKMNQTNKLGTKTLIKSFIFFSF